MSIISGLAHKHLPRDTPPWLFSLPALKGNFNADDGWTSAHLRPTVTKKMFTTLTCVPLRTLCKKGIQRLLCSGHCTSGGSYSLIIKVINIPRFYFLEIDTKPCVYWGNARFSCDPNPLATAEGSGLGTWMKQSQQISLKDFWTRGPERPHKGAATKRIRDEGALPLGYFKVTPLSLSFL